MDLDFLKTYSSEKRWYLYQGSKYQGPYSDHDIQRLLDDKVISQTTQLWAGHLSEWTALENISFLSQTLEKPPTPLKVDFAMPLPQDSTSIEEMWNQISKQVQFKSEELTFDEVRYKNEMKTHSPRLKIIAGVLVGVTFSAGLSMMIRNGAFSKEIYLQDLTATANRELKAAILQPTSAGPRAAIELVEGTRNNPQLVIGANSSDGTSLKVTIEGISETLLGTPDYSLETEGVIKEGLFRTPRFNEDPQAHIPQGQYQIRVLCQDCPDDMAEKVLFLGGDNDYSYELNLKKYHAELRNKSKVELLEFNQILGTLETEAALVMQANQSAKDKALYNNQMISQLAMSLASWEFKAERNEIYHRDLYKNLSQLFRLIQKNSISLQDPSANISNIEFLSDLSLAQTQMAQVKSQIQMLESLPTTTNGMPRRK